MKRQFASVSSIWEIVYAGKGCEGLWSDPGAKLNFSSPAGARPHPVGELPIAD
jgi:hypothetical protein